MSRTQHIASRAWVMFIAFAIFGLAIVTRIAMVQLDPQHAAGNAMLPQLRTIEPERGRILSAEGHLLAASVPRFDLHWDPTVIDTEKEKTEFLNELPGLAAACAKEFGKRNAGEWRGFLLDAHRTGDALRRFCSTPGLCYIYIYVCMYIYICIYIYMCIYIYTYIYI